MTKGRLEAFSDGVLAIIITIMVIELRPPEQTTIEALRPIIPAFLSYVLSFAIVGIYWNNHHHLFQAVRVVDGRVLWANLLLLFVLSLLPFGSAWMGEHEFAPVPVALYGVILLLAAIAFFVLVHTLLRIQPDDAPLAAAIGRDTKGKLSPLVYLVVGPDRARRAARGLRAVRGGGAGLDRPGHPHRADALALTVARQRSSRLRSRGSVPGRGAAVPRMPTTRSAYAAWRLMYELMNGHCGVSFRPRARTSSSAPFASCEPTPLPSNAVNTSVCVNTSQVSCGSYSEKPASPPSTQAS